MTSNRPNRGLAAMPGQQRSLPDGARGRGGEQSFSERQQEAMARNSSAQSSHQGSVGVQSTHWDEAGWDQEEAEGNRARRILSGSNSSLHRFGDKCAALQRWLTGERWVRRLAVVFAALLVIFAGCFFGLWWRLGAGPINL